MTKVLSWLAAIACLGLAGCGTADVNPSTPRARTGYVDFYTDSSLDLSWEVKRADQPGGEMRTVFWEFDPVQGTVLRLSAPPGKYRFQVWFLNLATEGPKIVEVDVRDGKITPVHVELKASGTADVDRKLYGFRASAKGYGRGTKIVTERNAVFRIDTTAEPVRAYASKQSMPYYEAAAPAQ
jgi:hypothetical protein